MRLFTGSSLAVPPALRRLVPSALSFRLGAVAALAIGLSLVGCSDDPPAGPEGTLSGSAGKPTALPGGSELKKPDPLVTKSYRADACYYGSLALKQARDAYLASLGGAEPSADKIPDFGADPDDAVAIPKTPMETPPASSSAAPTEAPPTGSAKPATAPSAASAKPATPPPATSAKPATPPPATSTKPAPAPTVAGSAKPSAAPVASAPAPAASSGTPAASGSVAATTPPPRNPNERMKTPVRYDSFIRHCNTAASVKDGNDADLDPVLREFTDFAMPLAKILQEANGYYNQEKYKEDSFAQGKVYHACLTGSGTCTPKEKNAKSVSNAFAQLPTMLEKLKAAVDKFHAAKPLDKGSFEESQKAADQLVMDATEFMLAYDSKPVDQAKAAAALKKLDADTTALKAFGDNKEKPDPWAKQVSPLANQLVQLGKTLEEKKPEEITPAKIYKVISLHNRIMEKNFAALQTKLREASGAGNRALNPSQRKVTPKMGPGPAHPPK